MRSNLSKALIKVAILPPVIWFILNLQVLCSTSPLSQTTGLYTYKFLIDEDGSANVEIRYKSNLESGSSWVFVPKFLNWINLTLHGNLTDWNLRETDEIVGVNYYFYKVLNFSFESDDYFELCILFNFTSAAMILEPDGIFYSPQIGFDRQSRGIAEIIFPSNFTIESGESVIIGNRIYSVAPQFGNASFMRLDLPENLVRIQIGFKTGRIRPKLINMSMGEFTFITVSRYKEYALNILKLYNRTYWDMVNLFNVTLTDIKVKFFMPDFNSLFSIGGYVPFTGKTIGDIHINIFYTRYVSGYIETIALHELVHHFLWKAGLSPQAFLWFHEGMAQYVSIEIANNLGYEGASIIKEDLEKNVHTLFDEAGGNLGFLLRWTPSSQPTNMRTLYLAAYFVISRLAERFGGFTYYSKFFRIIRNVEVEDNNFLVYYLSLAANSSVASILNEWGFNIIDLYTYPTFIRRIGEIIDMVKPFFQPYKFIAEQLYRMAEISIRNNDFKRANSYLALALLIAEMAPLLTISTISAVILTLALRILELEMKENSNMENREQQFNYESNH